MPVTSPAVIKNPKHFSAVFNRRFNMNGFLVSGWPVIATTLRRVNDP